MGPRTDRFPYLIIKIDNRNLKCYILTIYNALITNALSLFHFSGSASSLFGYRLTTTYSVAAVVRLRLQVAAKSQVIGNILNSNGQQTLVSTSQPPN